MTPTNKAAAPGIGGAVAIAPAEVRYVRVTVTEVGDENRAARIEQQLGRRTQHQRQKGEALFGAFLLRAIDALGLVVAAQT